MSFKKFSAAQDTPGKDSPVDKPKDAPVANQPANQSVKAPAKAAPTPKS